MIAPAGVSSVGTPTQEDLIQKIDIRVGKIISISEHAEADE